MCHYGKIEYWEERYTHDPEPFDWYQRFSGIKDIIMSNVAPENKILNVGAGNSRLSEEMFDEGFQNIVNIDISQTVVKAMQEKYKDKGPNYKYLLMDMRAMEFPDATFDCIIDKATLDSVLCGESSTSNVQKMLSEVNRVLGPKGVYIVVSYGQPEHRLPYLNKPEYGWEVLVNKVNKPTINTSFNIATDDRDALNVHYVYVCKKVMA